MATGQSNPSVEGGGGVGGGGGFQKRGGGGYGNKVCVRTCCTGLIDDLTLLQIMMYGGK